MPRPDKRSSLTLLTNERLRELAEGFELSPKSGMRHDELVELLASSKRASFETVLGVLKRAELKEVCRRHGLDDGGKAKEEIVARILGGGGRGSAEPGGQTALALERDAEVEVDAKDEEGFCADSGGGGGTDQPPPPPPPVPGEGSGADSSGT